MTSRQQASVYRQQVPALVKHIGWLASMAQGSSALLPGSIYGRRRRCGKPGCRCIRGHLHNDTVLAVVYEALLKSRRFTVSYRPRKNQVKPYEVNPLGLILKGSAMYLVATLWDYQDIKQLALHRFSKATLLDKDVSAPGDFSLDAYIAEGGFDYPTIPEHSIRLTVKINDPIKKYLSETPLSADQQITRLDAMTYQLQATVKDTLQLRWWLRSFAADVEIVEPLSLREEFVESAKALSQIYQV